MTTDGATAEQSKLAHYAGITPEQAATMSGADLTQAMLANQTATPVGHPNDGARYEQLMENPIPGATPAPTIAGLDPDSGAIDGSVGVTITGTNLADALVVLVGNVSQTIETQLNTDTEIFFYINDFGIGWVGAQSVTVVTAGGSVTVNNAYTPA